MNENGDQRGALEHDTMAAIADTCIFLVSCRKAIFHHGSPKQSTATAEPASSSGSSGTRHSKERSRDLNNSLMTGGSPQKAAPSKAQAATLAAYNPEPQRASEARGFVGANPAAAGGQQGLAVDNGVSKIPRQSPGLAAGTGGTGGNFEESRAKAEKMVNAEREARGRMPVYEGLPSQFQLELKMGE